MDSEFKDTKKIIQYKKFKWYLENVKKRCGKNLERIRVQRKTIILEMKAKLEACKCSR